MRSKTRKSKQKGGKDFSGQNLLGKNFSGQDLSGSNFSNAKLNKTNFSNAILTGADLTGAILAFADLTDAKLSGAKLSGANLYDADLTKADLTKADLTKADLTGAIFRKADLGRAILSGCYVQEWNTADFTGANLKGAILKNAGLTRANLTSANLTDADLTDADLTSANLTDSILERAKLTDATLIGAKLIEADLTNAILTNANLTRADLTDAFLFEANLTNANLTSANLTGADLSDAILSEQTNLTGATLINIRGLNLNSIPENLRQLFISQSQQISESIPKNVLNGNQNNKEKCKSFEKLFNFINDVDLDKKPIFSFEGQTGIDAGGLTRIVFDKYLQEFKRQFFVKKENSDLLKLIPSKNNNKQLLFEHSLEQLKKLREYSSLPGKQVKIFIKIDLFLLKILQSDNPKKLFTKANVNKYLKSNGKINKTNPNIIKVFNENAVFGNQLLQNNINENKRIKDWRENFTNDEVQDILLRFFLQLQGFKSMEQFKLMQKFIQENWNENFTNYIDYSLPAFSKRITIKFNNNFEQFNPNKNYTNMYSKNNNVKPFIDYIKESDENRIKFTELVTGTKFYDGLIKIIVNNSERDDKKPYVAHTCFQNIDIYPTTETIKKNGLVVQINTDLERTELNK